MEHSGEESAVWIAVKTLLILGLLSIIYEWLQMLAWRKKYKLKGRFPLPLIGTVYAVYGKPTDQLDVLNEKKFGETTLSFFGGMKVITVYSLDLLKKIFILESGQFQNRYVFDGLQPHPMDKTLFDLKDADWKRVRSILTPTFSSAKLKLMTKEINYCASVLTQGLVDKAKLREPAESRKHCGCYMMDVIASTAFGIRINSYSDPEDQFVTTAKSAFSTDTRALPFLLAFFLFFTDVCKKIINDRVEGKDTGHMDMMQLMINAELQDDESTVNRSSKKLSMDEMLAQGCVVFVAGYETTSTLLTFLSYVLAKHQDIQEKLVAEIEKKIETDQEEIPYDIITNMPYLDQVICETLRMYPPVLQNNRSTSKNADVEIDGHWFPRDAMIRFSVWHMHHNKDIYENPEDFNPNRFSPEEKAKRDQAAFMPFGQGPRNCIGMRLALLETKLAAIHMLRKIKFVMCSETEENLELEKGFFLRSKNPIKVGLELH